MEKIGKRLLFTKWRISSLQIVNKQKKIWIDLWSSTLMKCLKSSWTIPNVLIAVYPQLNVAPNARTHGTAPATANCANGRPTSQSAQCWNRTKTKTKQKQQIFRNVKKNKQTKSNPWFKSWIEITFLNIYIFVSSILLYTQHIRAIDCQRYSLPCDQRGGKPRGNFLSFL